MGTKGLTITPRCLHTMFTMLFVHSQVHNVGSKVLTLHVYSSQWVTHGTVAIMLFVRLTRRHAGRYSVNGNGHRDP